MTQPPYLPNPACSIELVLDENDTPTSQRSILIHARPGHYIKFVLCFLRPNGLMIPISEMTPHGPLLIQGVGGDKLLPLRLSTTPSRRKPTYLDEYVIMVRLLVPSTLSSFPYSCILRLGELVRVIPCALQKDTKPPLITMSDPQTRQENANNNHPNKSTPASSSRTEVFLPANKKRKTTDLGKRPKAPKPLKTRTTHVSTYQCRRCGHPEKAIHDCPLCKDCRKPKNSSQHVVCPICELCLVNRTEHPCVKKSKTTSKSAKQSKVKVLRV